MVDLITTNLISGFLEFVLFGIFLILCPVALTLLIRRHRVGAGQRVGAPGLDSQTTAVSSSRVLAVNLHRVLALVRSWGVTVWALRRSPLIIANVLFLFFNTVVSIRTNSCKPLCLIVTVRTCCNLNSTLSSRLDV